MVKGIEIYHPYGMVESLPFICQERGVGFGATLHATKLMDLTSQIKTFAEETDEGSSGIRKRIKEARQLVFLGFAFHPMNMELLLPSFATVGVTDSRVFAATSGLSSSDKEIISKDLVARGGLDEQNVELASSTCARFFRDYRRTLFFVRSRKKVFGVPSVGGA
ncbi:hypothetical protein SAMN05216315_13250 [Nitrosospira sp. Nsp18]|nr:hypothetical protein SAMN05216315_13250 [Nitrosospira sp. Nsp18]